MNKQGSLQDDHRRKVKKAIDHLKYSFAKVQKLPLSKEKWDEEIVETWESFAARFSRVSDLFLARYVRGAILSDDPGFRGSFRDLLDRAEKMGLIDSAETWMAIRELRNLAAHEYAEENLENYMKKLLKYAPELLSIEAKLGK